jgi:hypothetical protein
MQRFHDYNSPHVCVHLVERPFVCSAFGHVEWPKTVGLRFGPNSDRASLGLNVDAVPSIHPNDDAIAQVMLLLDRGQRRRWSLVLPRYE